MARDIKAFQFWIAPSDQPTSTVLDLVTEYMHGGGKAFEFDHMSQNYLATELNWTKAKKMLTGTVYRLRGNSLPVAVRGITTHDLPLKEDEYLGEPMCFAFLPDVGGALIHYSHTGPRHAVMGALLSRMGYADAIRVEPLIRTDMLMQLNSKSYIKGLEFSLTDPRGVAELREMGGSIGGAIKVLDDVGGVNIHVQVTMGHTKGEGLVTSTVKKFARALQKLASSAPEGESPVRTIKVTGADDEDAPLSELDLLRAREPITLMVSEQGRHLDRIDCQRKLAGELFDRRDKFRRQAGG